MATYGGGNFTSFKGVNLKQTTAVRLTLDGGFNGTVSAQSGVEADRSWTFPDKSGILPIMGTFAIQLPAIAATTQIQSTVATVSGIRAEDALSVIVNKGVSAGYGDMGGITSGGTARILATAFPGNGNITLTFFNLGVATGYVELVCSYLAMR